MASLEGGGASGNISTPPGRTEGSGAYLKCLCATTRSMRKKQDELETFQSYSIIGISETWWIGSSDWSAGMEGYRLFRGDRQGRQGGGLALCIRERFGCTALRVSDDVAED